MAEFKENLTQREEPNISTNMNAQVFDKSNLYRMQIENINGYNDITQGFSELNNAINASQKRITSNRIKVGFDTYAMGEQQIMATDPNAYFTNYAENQKRGKKQLEDSFNQINNSGLFNKEEMDQLGLELQGQFNNFFMQSNIRYAQHQKEATLTATDQIMEQRKELIQANSGDIQGVNRHLNSMDELTLGLSDFLEPEALFKRQIELSNYRDTVASGRIENYLDTSASGLEKTLQREIANGMTLEQLQARRGEYVNEIRTALIDPDFSLGLVTEHNFDDVVNRKFVNPVVNKAFDNAENQLVVNDVFNQVMKLVEKDGNVKDIEKHINDVTLENAKKLYKEGNLPAEKVMQIKTQVLGKLDETKASDIMKKYIGKGTPENFLKMQKKGAELQFDPIKNGLSGYGNVGGSVSSALAMESALVSENAQKAARSVVRSRGGRTSSGSTGNSTTAPTTTIDSNGRLIMQQSMGNTKTYQGNMFQPIASAFTMKGAQMQKQVMQQAGVISATKGGDKQARNLWKASDLVVKTWSERGSGAIQNFMPQLTKDGVVTQTNQFAPLLTSGGVINRGTAQAGLELSFTSMTNVNTRDSNNNLSYTPRQMYNELVSQSQSEKGGKRFTLFNENSPEIQFLASVGAQAGAGTTTDEKLGAIKSIHDYFSDPRFMSSDMSDIAIEDSLHILGYSPLVSHLATRSGGTNTIKDEAVLAKVMEYSMSEEELTELSKQATNVIGYDSETFKSYFNRSFVSYLEDDPVSTEWARAFVGSTVDNSNNADILQELNNVVKGYVLKETMRGRDVGEIGVQEFVKEIANSFISDYHVVQNKDKGSTLFIDKNGFDDTLSDYIVSYSNEITDPARKSQFLQMMSDMNEEDLGFNINRHMQEIMNERLSGSGLSAFQLDSTIDTFQVTTAQEAFEYSRMLGRPVNTGEMLYTIRNLQNNTDIPFIITQDEIIERFVGEARKRNSIQGNNANITPPGDIYTNTQYDSDIYMQYAFSKRW